jgi:tetratricopeptide (TPR) repeat protein
LHDVLRRAFDSENSSRAGALVGEVARDAIKPGDVVDVTATPKLPRLSGSYTEAILSVFSRVADALEHAHQQGIIHSDLKPSNILLDATGSPLLLDFNLSFRDVVMQVAVGGTFAYMPPESIRAAFLSQDETRNDRVDVFSFGAVLYHLLSGTIPFDVEERPAPPLEGWARRAVATIDEGPLRIGQDLKHVHPNMVTLIRRCLAADSQQRPPMSEVAAELRRYFKPIQRARRSKRLRVVLALVAAASILAGTVLATRAPYAVREMDAGKIAAKEGKPQQAVTHFENVVRDDPKHHDAWYRLAQARLDSEDWEAAYDAMSEAVALAPENGEYLAFCGYVAGKNEDVVRALAFYRGAISFGYTSAGTHNNLGYCFWQRRLAAQAEAALTAAIDANDKLPQPYLNRAILALEFAVRDKPINLPRALADIERAMELLPDSAEAAFVGACLYSVAAQKDRTLLSRALDLLLHARLRGIDPRNYAIDEFVEAPPMLAHLEREEGYTVVRNATAQVPFVRTPRSVDPTRGLGAK